MSIDRLVVAVGGDDQRRRSGDTTTEDAQHVERRVVGPVHILEHEHHRLAQLLQQRQRHLARVPAGLDIQREPSADLHSDIEATPSGGMASCSQAPSRTRPSTPAMKARTSAVLPTPASPPTNRSRPPSPRASASRANSASRSISRGTRRPAARRSDEARPPPRRSSAASAHSSVWWAWAASPGPQMTVGGSPYAGRERGGVGEVREAARLRRARSRTTVRTHGSSGVGGDRARGRSGARA